jgi:nitroreductase
MSPVSQETLLGQLRWRYATKRFDPDRKIEPENWRTLEQALVHAPSSFGLQPWKFFVITDSALRARLKAASWNQAQISDASHLVVFAVRRDLGAADVDRYIARIAEVRGLPVEALEGFRNTMLGSLRRPAEEVRAWAARQVYIALGFFLSAAAILGIDACPMEGFQPEKYDEILGLTGKGYAATVLAAAGYRSPDDPYLKLAKVRFRTEDVIEHLGS